MPTMFRVRKKNMSSKISKEIVIFFSLVFSAACGLLEKSGQKKQADGLFRPTEGNSEALKSVPADIAEGIGKIDSGKKWEGSSYWKPHVGERGPSVQTDGGQGRSTFSDTENSAQSNLKQGHEKSGENTSDTSVADSTASRKSDSGRSEKYKIQSGDTLMKISFEKYGNFLRWREIWEVNKDVIPNFNLLRVGTTITIEGVEFVVINKNGLPYLIRRGDTLGKISKDLYGINEGWKILWKNNPQLIRNPNKIYAGFTLYYEPVSEVFEKLEELKSQKFNLRNPTNDARTKKSK